MNIGHLKKLFMAVILLSLGGVSNLQAQSGCNGQCDAPVYCVTNKEIDCSSIKGTIKVYCNGNLEDSCNFDLGPSTCSAAPTQKCCDFPDCQDCEVVLEIEGTTFNPGDNPKCISHSGTCPDFFVGYDEINGTCLKYNPGCNDHCGTGIDCCN